MFVGLGEHASDVGQNVDIASVAVIEARSIDEDDLLPIYDSRDAGCVMCTSLSCQHYHYRVK